MAVPGQISRRPLRRWPPVDEPGIPKHKYTLECLLPTDYRNFEERLERGESHAGLDPIYGDRIAAIRSLVTTYLIQCHSCWNDQQIQGWYNGLNGADRADKLLSIGQHYGLRTHELDMTSDWQVALWFATHDWTTGNYVPGGDGVIYRFDVHNLIKAETKANRDLAVKIAKERFRDVDIRDTSPILAPRALAQRGFTLIRAESPHLIQAIIQQNAIEALVFPRGIQPATDNCLTRDLIVPPHDQMSALYEECRAAKKWPEITKWLAQPGYAQYAANATDHQHLF